jgi:hypothetical protein
MAEAAAVASIASLGLSAAGSITKGSATKAADEFQADRAEPTWPLGARSVPATAHRLDCSNSGAAVRTTSKSG